ncbi:hypothetical protein DNL40_12855 [Xylanimonas oleitrophica]|uniref:D-alanyl-D-alanine carboxypeptidase-like core domain-containing protein n=1 Tax=Xylanimonas oleitrophica TaxID=2607479 RepID=A0A2W5WVJ6_9MICO|nr:DUF2809 domain-containing protein [Xylanimonas oleitrophica]PZR52306.1 hypothetical protein DNL40_12855 [Xylanimonas oleitrophica]
MLALTGPRRTTTALLAVVVALAGLAARAALPPAVGGPAGDALYATLVVLLVVLVRPRTTVVVAAAAGFAVSAAVELAQLTPVPSAVVAAFEPARYVLGTTFTATDLAWYAVGAAVGGGVVALATIGSLGREDRVRHGRRLTGRRPGRAAVLVGVPVAVVGLATGGLALTMHTEAQRLASEVATARAALEDSAGKVADDAVRGSLAASVDRAEAVLARTPLIQRRPGDADAARQRVEADAAVVQAARLEHARAEAGVALDALGPATGRGEQVYAATDGLGADEVVRGAVRAALDEAGRTAATVGSAAAGQVSDPVRVEQATSELTARHAAVERATADLMTAQDAITCPEPDQLWFPEAGRLDPALLAPIPWAPRFSLRADVLDDLVALNEAYRARFGQDLTITSAYRTYEQQLAVYNPANPNPLAAPPGCSNHGLGTAVDLGGGVASFDSPQYAWLKENAEQHGWTHPDWAEPGGRLPEPWHWESVLTPVSY